MDLCIQTEGRDITNCFGKCSPNLFLSSHYLLNKDNHTSLRDLKRALMTFNENTMEVERIYFKSFRKTAVTICWNKNYLTYYKMKMNSLGLFFFYKVIHGLHFGSHLELPLFLSWYQDLALVITLSWLVSLLLFYIWLSSIDCHVLPFHPKSILLITLFFLVNNPTENNSVYYILSQKWI